MNLASLVAQLVKSLPAMQETRVRSLGWEDPLETGMTTHSSILAWRIHVVQLLVRFPGGSDGKESACSEGNLGSIPGSGRSPGEGNGCPLQCSCLENSGTEEPDGLQSMRSQRVGHNLVTKTNKTKKNCRK